MKIFKLPDLGEGLPDAIIREWHIKPGDAVEKDQLLVSVETAKALVDVPAPFDGVIAQCFGSKDDTIETGEPLIGFEGESEAETQDTGTVVGKIEQSDTVLSHSTERTEIAKKSTGHIKATPAVRALARQLGVSLQEITPTGERITAEEVQSAAKNNKVIANTEYMLADATPLSSIKRAMVLSMKKSHHEIVPVTIHDDADIHAWQGKQDITVRIIQAIIYACSIEPALNAQFDGQNMRVSERKDINLGLAVDMPHGLFVPVINDVANKNNEQLREIMNIYKAQASNKTISQKDMQDATILLSNFGVIAGKYANPIIVPPTVAIVGIGRLHKAVVPDNNDQPVVHKVIPISLTIDHRAITGGEAARFLAAMIEDLSK